MVSVTCRHVDKYREIANLLKPQTFEFVFLVNAWQINFIVKNLKPPNSKIAVNTPGSIYYLLQKLIWLKIRSLFFDSFYFDRPISFVEFVIYRQ